MQKVKKKAGQVTCALAEVDPDGNVFIHDSQRIQCIRSSRRIGKFNAVKVEIMMPEEHHMINIAIAPHDRAILHERIAHALQNVRRRFVEECSVFRAAI